MVNSRLVPRVNYSESRNIDSDDMGHTSDIFKGVLFKKDINFILGKANYKYIENGIIYLNIYLVNLSRIVCRIGIYEIESIKYSRYLNENGDIDIEKLEIPIFFKFTETYIRDKYFLKDDIEDDVKSKEEDSEKLESDREIESSNKSKSSMGDESEDFIKKSKSSIADKLPPLKTQTNVDSEEEKRIYYKDTDTKWIEEFMKNNNYKLIDNEGGGDCLFAVIRDGLEKIGKKVSIKELRMRLSQEANEEIFLNYKQQYDMFLKTYQVLNKELKDIVEKNKELREKMKEIVIREEQKKIVAEASILSKRHKQIKEELSLTKELLKEYLFMKDVKTLGDFKGVINSCKFWAETWAISTLERILNIKLIILSSRQWQEKEVDNILQCGQLNDTILQERNEFKPDNYILVDYTGDHYRLITYKNRGAITFSEIPYDIKVLVVNKCMERQAGPFYIIPEFKNFADELKIDVKDIDTTDVNVINNLYNNNIVFQFYSKSNDKPLPGKGTGETIPPEKIKDFVELSKIKEWRKKLSNFWTSNPIKLDGLTWLSVEHYYQANKFKINNPDFYKLFSLESSSNISKEPELAKAAGGKTGKKGSQQIRDKKILMDKDFDKQSKVIMEKAMYAKFTQHDDLKQLLIATRDAKLVHFVRANPPQVFEDLMNVRKMIIK
tara:strand:+ start:8746 stop:10743 length:1998 start_codon:yes stop_codon:yes gene_type:complete